MKVARSAAIAGCGGTSNVAAAMRYGLEPVGTMAHSYVLSFPGERQAFEAYLRLFPDSGVLLVDTYDVEQGVRNAIEASRATGVPLRGIRIDSGDLSALARRSRRLLDEAGMEATAITVSGDLEEGRIAALVADGVPVDRFGVGTDLGTSRDSPTVNGVYKLVAHARGEAMEGVRKLSADKQTLPGAEAGLAPPRRGDDGRGPGRRSRRAATRAKPCWCRSFAAARSSGARTWRRCVSGPTPACGRSRRSCVSWARTAVEPYPVAISAALSDAS